MFMLETESKIRITETSSQDVGICRYILPPCTTKRRTTTNLKSKKQPELPENRTVWKFDNQGVKEETFIGGTETGSQVEKTHGKEVADRAGGPTFVCR